MTVSLKILPLLHIFFYVLQRKLFPLILSGMLLAAGISALFKTFAIFEHFHFLDVFTGCFVYGIINNMYLCCSACLVREYRLTTPGRQVDMEVGSDDGE
jgi:hypothetical protein